MAANEVKLFNRWSFEDVRVDDLCLADYIAVSQKSAVYLPHTAGRYNAKRFRKAQCPIVERLVCSLMMHGRNNGKKVMAVRIVRHAFEIIHLLTDQNPIQVLVEAVVNSGPREDSTRIGSAGTVRRQAVDVSPMRRVNVALYLLCTGAREAAFRSIKTIAECLADELINAAKGSSNSYAIKKKDEVERVAKANPMDNNNPFSFNHQAQPKPPSEAAPLRLTSRRVTFQPRKFAACVERPRSFRTTLRGPAPPREFVQTMTDHGHLQHSHDESQAQELRVSVQTSPAQLQQTDSNHSHPEHNVSAGDSSRRSSSGSSQSISSHGQVCIDSNGASSHSSGEQTKHAVNDRLDVLRNMIGALIDLDSLPRKLLQELSKFAEDVLGQFDRASQAKDKIALLSLDIDTAKQELRDGEVHRMKLEEQLRERIDETNLKSQNIEKLEFRLVSMKRKNDIEIEKAQSQIDTLQSDQEVARRELRMSLEKLDEARKEIEKEKGNLAKAEEIFEAKQNEWNAELAQVRQETRDLQEKVKEWREKESSAKKDKECLREKLTILQQDRVAYTERMEKFEKDLKSYLYRVTVLESEKNAVLQEKNRAEATSETLLELIRTFLQRMVTCHSAMVASDTSQAKRCSPWIFERDLNSSRLVTQNMSEDGIHAIAKIELLFQESTTINMEHMGQLMRYGGKWLQELCDGIILQRRAAREMFMGLRKLVGHNVKVVKDEMKALRSGQDGVDQACHELSTVRQQIALLRKDGSSALDEIEKGNETLLESVCRTEERIQAVEGILRQQEKKCTDAEKSLCEVRQQRDNADRQAAKKLSELQASKKDLNAKVMQQADELHAERERFMTDKLGYQEEVKKLNLNLEIEKSKALEAVEQMHRLQSELSAQRGLAEATKDENLNAERQKRESAEKSREECLITLKKAEQEIEYLTKWAHERSMELQKKGEEAAGLLEENRELHRNVELLLKAKDDATVEASHKDNGSEANKSQTHPEETTENRDSSRMATFSCSNDKTIEIDEAGSEERRKSPVNKSTRLEKNQDTCTVNEAVSGAGAKNRQKRTRAMTESDGSKRRRASARILKPGGIAPRERGDDGPSSARTAGIQICTENGKKQQREGSAKRREDVGDKLQDDDFLVCDDLYSDNVLE